MSVKEHLELLEAKGDLPRSQHLEAMQSVANRFAKLLDENEQGLASWWIMVGEQGRELSAHLKHAGLAD